MTTATVQLKTHRYEFSEHAMMELNYFTKVHRYDERKAFKEAWKKWIANPDIREMIETERIRLVKEGFSGDIEDKMFTAVRYYFRKKMDIPEESESNTKTKNNKKEQKQRKPYTGFTGNMLTAIDMHIIDQIRSNLKTTEDTDKQTIFKCNVSPDKSFAEFCELSSMIIKDESEKLSQKMSTDDIHIKIKKTYKNRYQTIRKKLSESFAAV